jgi:hypothetical protein
VHLFLSSLSPLHPFLLSVFISSLSICLILSFQSVKWIMPTNISFWFPLLMPFFRSNAHSNLQDLPKHQHKHQGLLLEILYPVHWWVEAKYFIKCNLFDSPKMFQGSCSGTSIL